MRYLSLLSLLACAALLACGQEQAPTASGPAGKASGGDLFDLFKAGGSTIVGVDSTAAETETPADTTATAPSDTTEAAVVDTVATVTGGGGGDAPSTSIRLSASPHTISEDAAVTQIVLTVTLNKALDADASVFISIDPNSEAVRDVDYSALFNPLLIIPAGSTSGSFSLLIDPTADRENEGNETITLTASTPGLTSGSVQITLSESAASERGGGGGGGGGGDAPSTSIRLSARPHTISEDAAVTEIVLTATLNGRALDADATVTISVDPNSEAVREVDYSALFNPLLIIPAGSTSGSFPLLIDPTADRENEGNETITLTASTPGLTSGSVQITLSEDPVATVPEDPTEPVVSLSPEEEEARAALAEGGIDFTADAFVRAARFGALAVVRLFVWAGMSLEAKNDDGWTALHGAAYGEHLEVVEFLVGAGAAVNAKDRRGRTPRRLAYCGRAVARYLASVGGEGGCWSRSGGGGGDDDDSDDDDDSGGGGGGGGGCSVGQVVGPGQSCGAGGGTFRNVGGGCFVYTPVGSGRVCGGGGSFNGLGVSRSGDNFTITAVP